MKRFRVAGVHRKATWVAVKVVIFAGVHRLPICLFLLKYFKNISLLKSSISKKYLPSVAAEQMFPNYHSADINYQDCHKYQSNQIQPGMASL